MFTNWLTYRATAEALNLRLAGAVIEEAFSQDKAELVLGLSHPGGGVHVQCSLQPRLTHLLIKPGFARARKNSVNLFEGMLGERVDSIDIASDDRILRMGFESGRQCFFYLFPTRGNIVFMDRGGRVMDSFKPSIAEINLVGMTFGLRWNGDPVGDLGLSLATSTAPGMLKFLSGIRPWITGTFALEVLHRSRVDAEAKPSAMSTAERQSLVDEFRNCLAESSSGKSFVYLADQIAVSCSPLRLTHARDLEEHAFTDILEAMLFYLRRYYAGTDFTRRRDMVHAALRRELERAERTLGKLQPPGVLREQAALYEKYGNLLMINLYETPQHPHRMVVPDMFTDPRLMFEVPLKERLSVLENAQRYFEKSQQTKASIRYVEQRQQMLHERLTRLHAFEDALTHARSTDELKELFTTNAGFMEELGLTGKGEKQDRPFPFRRFHVAGGFEVWVGKSSANNDELTLRYAKPNDIWMHARGVGGSHVVIKVGSAEGNPGKDSIREAAAIAAYYSKYRNAGSVPVAYTERKYVRKPKGVPAGTVTLEREKVVMVKPGLPGDEE